MWLIPVCIRCFCTEVTANESSEQGKKLYISDIRSFSFEFQLLLLCVFFSIWFLFVFCVRSAWRKWWSFFLCASLLHSLIHFAASCTTNKYDLRIESHLVYMTRESLCALVADDFFSRLFLHFFYFFFFSRSFCLSHMWNMFYSDSVMHMLLAKQEPSVRGKKL